ncbi:MAG: putative baseplate assembly protein [Acidimicrobiales bacterium]
MRTPRPVANRAGLTALRYRVGTHADFLATMLARRSSSRFPALRGLRTGERSDWSIALLDAWAVAADVLTFSTERIANEGYLGTATELRSVLELARLVGYELRPGVAAGTHLAFTLDPGHEVVVPTGTRARSVPGPGEFPQTFETSAPLAARATLNRLGLRLHRPQLGTGADPLYLAGVNLALKATDALLVRAAPDVVPTLRLVAAVTEQRLLDRTAVSFAAPPRAAPVVVPIALSALVRALVGGPGGTGQGLFDGEATAGPPGPRFPASDDAGDAHLRVLATLRPELAPSLTSAWAAADATESSRSQVWAMRVRAPVFGHNAPPRITSVSDNGVPTFGEWDVVEPGFEGDGTPREVPDRVDLDAPFDKMAAGDWAVVDYSGVPEGHRLLPKDGAGKQYGPGRPLVTRVKAVSPTVSRKDYGMSATTTRLHLEDDWISFEGVVAVGGTDFDIIRGTVVYTLAQELALAGEPVDTPVFGDVLELDALYEGIESGRTLVVAGERSDVPGTSAVMATEVVEVAAVAQATAVTPKDARPGDKVHTWVLLTRPLRHAYRRDGVVVHGNVAHATNGESRAEVLGGGDAAKALQRFALRKPPLTFVSAPTPSGVASSLEVRVNDVRWPEVAGLAELGPATRGYVATADEARVTTVVFGDGEHGARPPTGDGNIRSRYRDGIGKAANVAAGSISLLATKPLGVKDVVNPVPATGGADPDRVDQARVNAPLPLRALERLVSLSDYADLAATFAGIGKAAAGRLLDRRRQVVLVTVAGVDDIPLDEDGDVLANLRLALRRWGDRDLRVAVRSREVLLARLGVQVTADADRDPDVVAAAVRAKLEGALGFGVRSLGQDLTESEVLLAVHQVPGVTWATVGEIAALRYADGDVDVVEPLHAPAGGTYHPGRRVVALEARTEGGIALPAQLVYLSAGVPEALRVEVTAR